MDGAAATEDAVAVLAAAKGSAWKALYCGKRVLVCAAAAAVALSAE